MSETATVMNLSKNTRMETKVHPTHGLPVVTVFRQKKSGEESKLFLDNEDCEVLAGNVMKIKETIARVQTMQDGESLPIPFGFDLIADVSKYKDNVYCGIFHTYPDGKVMRKGGMNFGMPEWYELSKYLTKTFSSRISGYDDDEADAPSSKRQKLEVGPYRVTKQYLWKWTKNGQILKESTKGFYYDKACMDKALVNQPDDSQALIEIHSTDVTFTCDKSFVEEMYLFLLGQEINDLRVQNCEGCEMTCPGQSDHMNGCLLPWDESVEIHLANAQASITKGHLLNLYHKILTYMCRSYQTNADELEYIIKFDPPQNLEYTMQHLVLIYHDLFETAHAM